MKYLVLLMLMISQLAWAEARQVDDYHWTGVERIIAIGDIHGDYDHYISVLRDSGLVDSRGKWTGGETHLVQVGDIPDRGPDTLKIIEHLQELAKEASRKGGQVHSLVGNHEAMNVYGDLSYTTPEEFAAFANRNSEKLRDRYFDIVLQSLRQNDPETFKTLPDDFRESWNKDHPLGWLEHRQAWSTAWNPKAKIAEWILDRKVAIQINDLIFLHGGISGFYCKNSLQSMTEMAVSKLRNFDPKNPGILMDENGPLWYRGLSGAEPAAAPETVDAILEQHDAKHIVVGHTPTLGVIWPRYGGEVIQIDTGISAAYGGHLGYLEVTPDGLFAGYPGGKIKLPEDESGLIPYLEQVVAQDPDNAHLQRMLARLKNPPPPPAENVAAAQAQQQPAASEQQSDDSPGGGTQENAEGETADNDDGGSVSAAGGAAASPEKIAAPICGISE